MAEKSTSMNKRQIAGRIKTIRENAGYTQEQFSEILGISVSALKKIESGENQVSVSCLQKLNEGMNVSADWVLFGKTTDIEALWRNIENSSEEDKMFVMLRLIYYFTKMKKIIYREKGEQETVNDEIIDFLRSLKNHGENECRTEF